LVLAALISQHAKLLVYWKEEVAMNHRIAIHRTAESISVSVPALPGRWSEGDTEEEALANVRDAIREYLSALEDRYREAEAREAE
jgi:predicted RNase H-like HicB family nuclease